jgi:hypothetical protein
MPSAVSSKCRETVGNHVGPICRESIRSVPGDELVGIAGLDTGDHVARFCDLDIGLIDRRGLSGIMPVQNVDNHSG